MSFFEITVLVLLILILLALNQVCKLIGRLGDLLISINARLASVARPLCRTTKTG